MTALLSPGLIILTYSIVYQQPSEFWLMRHNDASFAYVLMTTRDAHGRQAARTGARRLGRAPFARLIR